MDAHSKELVQCISREHLLEVVCLIPAAYLRGQYSDLRTRTTSYLSIHTNSDTHKHTMPWFSLADVDLESVRRDRSLAPQV